MKYLTDAEIARYSAAIQRGIDYVLRCQRPSGWLQPDDQKPDVVLTYNIPTFLCQSGQLAAARRFFEYMNAQLSDPYDGLPAVDPNTVWATHTTYFKGWVAYGAHQLGFYDTSLKLVHTLDRFIDRETGGVYVTEKGARNRTVTSFFRGAPIAMAMMITGRMDMAHRIGESLLRQIFNQPDPDKFYGYQDGKTGKVVTDGVIYTPAIYGYEPSADEEPMVFDEFEMDQACFCSDVTQDYQGWALYGPTLNFLMGMYYATDDRRYLDGSMQVFELFWRNRPGHSTEYVSSCKILQGLPQMYRATKDERILTAIRELSDYLCKMQHEEGFWVKETIQGLGREVSLEEQEEKGPWIKLCQIGDCGLSLQNVLKWLG